MAKGNDLTIDYGSQKFEDRRKTLLEQYHSQTITHAGYILALIVGMFAIVSEMEKFANAIFLFLLIISLLIGVGIFFACRLCYWSSLGSWGLYITQENFEKRYREKKVEGSCIYNIQDYIISYLENLQQKNIPSKIGIFATSFMRLIIVSLIPLISMVFLWIGYVYLLPIIV